MTGGMIIQCAMCTKHEYQDKRYGDKMRVCNLLPKKQKDDPPRLRCTVCGKEHYLRSGN